MENYPLLKAFIYTVGILWYGLVGVSVIALLAKVLNPIGERMADNVEEKEKRKWLL